VDRKKDLIISGGENIYPVEIENVIRRHPKVHDVRFLECPIPDSGKWRARSSRRQSGEDLTEQEMGFFCEQNLPRYKRPRQIIFAQVRAAPPQNREAQAPGKSTARETDVSLFALLEKRQAINRPVRIGVIGAGTFSSAFLNQVRRVPGMKVVCIADLAGKSERACIAAGWPEAAVEMLIPHPVSTKVPPLER